MDVAGSRGFKSPFANAIPSSLAPLAASSGGNTAGIISAFRPSKAVLPQMIGRRTGVIIGLASRNVGLFVWAVVLLSRCGWGLCDPWYRNPHEEFEPT